MSSTRIVIRILKALPLFALIALTMLAPEIALADVLGRPLRTLYFTGGSYSGNGFYVMSSGRRDHDTGLVASNSAEFKAKIRSLLYRTDTTYDFSPYNVKNAADLTHDEIGAAFIINTMMKVNGSSFSTTAQGITNAKNIYGDWTSAVDRYSAAGCVNYDLGGVVIPANTVNSLYDTTRHDDMFYHGPASSPTLIRFYELRNDGTCNFGHEIYSIKKNCGNPLGNLEGLEPQQNQWEYDINTNVQASVLVGNTFNVSSTISNSSGTDGADAFPSDLYAHRIEITSGSGLVTRTAGGNADDNLISAAWRWDGAGSGIDNGRQRIHTSTWRANGVGQVCFRSRVWPSEGPAGGFTNAFKNSTIVCINITNSPSPIWDYDSDVTVLPATAFPNQLLTITSEVTNNNVGTGLAYTHRIESSKNENWLTMVDGGANPDVGPKNARWYNRPGLAGNATSPTRSGQWRINSNTPDGTEICFKGSTGPSEGEGANIIVDYRAGPDRCLRVVRNAYNYVPSINAVGSHYPGSDITVTGNITNSGTGGVGMDYVEKIYVWKGMDQLNSSAEGVWSESGLANGATKSRNKVYTIKNDADNNAEICFSTWVNPNTGLATPGTTTNGGGPAIVDACINVYNERFDLSEPVISGVPQVANPGEILDLTYSVCNDDDENTWFSVGSPISRGIAPSVNITSLPEKINPGLNTTQDIGPGGCWGDNTTFTVPIGASVGEEFCIAINSDKNYGFSDNTSLSGIPPLQTGRKCFKVGVTPYLHVLNGDVWAGANFDTSTPPLGQVPYTCGADNADARISTINFHDATSGLWRGSFVEVAAIATGDVEYFGSNQNAGSNYLTFANNDAPAELGNYSDSPKCIANYYDLLQSSSEEITAASVVTTAHQYENGHQYWKDGNLVIQPNSGGGGGGTQYQKNVTFVVNGDVKIDSNGTNTELKYIDDYDASAVGVPSLIIVAKGDIHIDPSVTRIDAILISHGEIWTCSTGDASVDANNTYLVAENVCDEQLVINGALVANRINFMRTHEGGGKYGGVHDPNSEPAEIINFHPEFYLSNPVFISEYVNNDAYRTVLSKDLPPVY